MPFDEYANVRINDALGRELVPDELTFRHWYGNRMKKHTDYTVNFLTLWQRSGDSDTERKVRGLWNGDEEKGFDWASFREVHAHEAASATANKDQPAQGEPPPGSGSGQSGQGPPPGLDGSQPREAPDSTESGTGAEPHVEGGWTWKNHDGARSSTGSGTYWA